MFHTLRHSFATHLPEDGADMRYARMVSMRLNSVYAAILYLVLVPLLGACYPLVNPADMQTAKAEVEVALAQVPPPDFVTVIRIVPEDFDDSEYRNWGDRACAYARRWVIIVSSRPQDEVVKAYVAQLEAIGFQLKGGQYAHTATLYRGNQDFADIGYFTDGAWFSSHVEYEQLHQSYATVMELELQTVVPDRRTCGQWSEDELSTPITIQRSLRDRKTIRRCAKRTAAHILSGARR